MLSSYQECLDYVMAYIIGHIIPISICTYTKATTGYAFNHVIIMLHAHTAVHCYVLCSHTLSRTIHDKYYNCTPVQ